MGVVPFSYVYTQLILFSFSGLQCKIITSCCCHQLYLAWRNSTINIGYSHPMPCYLNRKCNLLYSYENYECHYWLQTCSFSDWSYLYIILHLAPALTCLSSSVNPSTSALWLIHEVSLHSFLSCNMLQVILLWLHCICCIKIYIVKILYFVIIKFQMTHTTLSV